METFETLLPLLCVAMQQSTTLYKKPATSTATNLNSTTSTPSNASHRALPGTPSRRGLPSTPSRQGATPQNRLIVAEAEQSAYGDVSMMEESEGSRGQGVRIADMEEPANSHKRSVSVYI